MAAESRHDLNKKYFIFNNYLLINLLTNSYIFTIKLY